MRFITTDFNDAVYANVENDSVAVLRGVDVTFTGSGAAFFNGTYANVLFANYGHVFGGLYGVRYTALASGGRISNAVGGDLFGGQSGIFAEAAGMAMSNAGSVTGLGTTGVYMGGDGQRFTNTSTGIVQGRTAGVTANGNEALIRNSGEISGDANGIVAAGFAAIVSNSGTVGSTTGNAIEFTDDYGALRNSGTIVAGGHAAGVHYSAVATYGLITNSGEIHGGTGVTIYGATGTQTTIYNSGLISGASYSVYLFGSDPLTIRNTGTLSGSVFIDSPAADFIRNAGIIDGHVYLTDGADVFHGVGGSVTGEVYGGAGDDRLIAGDNDTVVGEAGNDILRGGGVTNWLSGGSGVDLLYGGAGADIFVYTHASETPVAGNDKIYGFSRGSDVIDLSAIDASGALDGDQAFTFIGTAAFSGVAGQLRVTAAGFNLLVQGDVNGDGAADFRILLAGSGNQAADFTSQDFVV